MLAIQYPEAAIICGSKASTLMQDAIVQVEKETETNSETHNPNDKPPCTLRVAPLEQDIIVAIHGHILPPGAPPLSRRERVVARGCRRASKERFARGVFQRVGGISSEHARRAERRA